MYLYCVGALFLDFCFLFGFSENVVGMCLPGKTFSLDLIVLDTGGSRQNVFLGIGS